MTNKKIAGRIGENAAEAMLKQKGYKILKRNFATKFGEIDLVAMDGEVLVFVEVKAKTGSRFGEPWEMVNKKKLERVQRMGEVYIQKSQFSKPNFQTDCRVDVVGVWLDRSKNVEKIEHWEGVY